MVRSSGRRSFEYPGLDFREGASPNSVSTPLIPHSWGRQEKYGDTPDPGRRHPAPLSICKWGERSDETRRHCLRVRFQPPGPHSWGETKGIGGHPQTPSRDELHPLLSFPRRRESRKGSRCRWETLAQAGLDPSPDIVSGSDGGHDGALSIACDACGIAD